MPKMDLKVWKQILNVFISLSETVPRTLPWTPKVRQKDLDSFLDYTRMKFVGFTLKEDRTTLAGLPDPIHEGVKILNTHMYKSLAELQIEVRKNNFIKTLFTRFKELCKWDLLVCTIEIGLLLDQKLYLKSGS